VKLAIDAQFLDERERFRLAMHCEDCAHFDPDRDRCVHGYPAETHKRPADAPADLSFCKEFELV
jgi:hypothetical protein